MLNATTKAIIRTAAKADGLSPEKIAAMLAVADGGLPSAREAQLLLTQAQKARQLGVSRFTIRKMAQAGKLHPVELLPGLFRYRADEFVGR